MQVYFSHSYRDVAVNAYFLQHFLEEDVPLRADQKTDIWCVAKLERYLSEATGFVSIIPRRPTESDPGAYSPYIGQELSLARRSRVPRLLFVDEHVLKRHRLNFPEDAVPFKAEAPEEYGERHRDAIQDFRGALDRRRPLPREFRAGDATVVFSNAAATRGPGHDVIELLKRNGYSVNVLTNRLASALDDVRVLETLWRSELCVYVLHARTSDAHMVLAMGHAHGIPSIRLVYDKDATDCSPSVSGVIRWRSAADMLVEFERQLVSYREGLVRPVEMARSSSAADAARQVATMRWRSAPAHLWDVGDGPALAHHLYPEHPFVQDEVNRVARGTRKAVGRDGGRERSMEVCRSLYDGLCRHRFAYEFEPEVGAPRAHQVIRPPSLIEAHSTATCIDVACLFASLLEAAAQDPVIAVVEGPQFAHALAGYRALDEGPWPNPTVGDLRRALSLGDVVLFECTGALESEKPVGAESPSERREKLLNFMDAKAAAKRMIDNPAIRLKHLLDVRSQRARGRLSVR